MRSLGLKRFQSSRAPGEIGERSIVLRKCGLGAMLPGCRNSGTAVAEELDHYKGRFSQREKFCSGFKAAEE